MTPAADASDPDRALGHERRDARVGGAAPVDERRDAVAREARAEALADEEPVDEGLAAERTELAWSRSGLAMMACGVVVARGLPTIDAVPRRPVVGVTILGLGAVAWALGLFAARRRRAAPGTPRPVARWRDLAPVAVGSTVIGVAAFFLVVFQRA